MTERGLGWWVMASVALHMAGVAAGSFHRPSVDIPPGPTVPIEVVRIPAPEPPPPPPPPRVKTLLARIIPRAPEPKPVEPPPLLTPKLLEPPPPPAAAPPPDSAPVATALPSPPAPSGPPSSAGALFSGGDLLVAPGSGGGTVGVAPAPRPPEAPAEAKPAPQVAVATTKGLTSVARPIGEYQVKPEYPDRARKAHAEGTTVLRIEVLANGRVGEVVVARSAGRGDFDEAAIAAVKQWHFEPARRGSTAVAMWATLPVQFKLSDR